MDEDDEDLAYAPDEKADDEKTDRFEKPLWQRQLQQSVKDWLEILPKSLSPIKRTLDNIKDPLFRFFEREINTASTLLKTVLFDLNDVLQICDNLKKQTNYHRQLIKDLAKGMIPGTWRKYTFPKSLIVQPWIVDFAERISQMSEISSQFAEQGIICNVYLFYLKTNTSSNGIFNITGSMVLKTSVVWLGGLFTPEAFITATRQYVAQANSWSLEELVLSIQVHENAKSVALDECSFQLTGLQLQGASCDNNLIKLSSNVSNELPMSVIRWSRRQDLAPQAANTTQINLPVYLNATRSQLLFTLGMDTEQSEALFYMRGVAIVASKLN